MSALAVVTLASAITAHAVFTAEHGVKFEWFDGENFETKVGQRVSSKISTVFGEAAAGRGGARDHFSCRWSGFVCAPRPGTYEFKAWADDGCRLKLDGNVVIDGWNDATAQTTAAKFTNDPREIVFEMREAESLASATLLWRRSGEATFVPVPPSALFQSKDLPTSRKVVRPKGQGLTVTVFRGRNLKNEVKCDIFEDGIDDDIDWNFIEGGIDPAAGSDNFSMRWKGYVVAPSAGTWRIKAWADNGVRVKIDDVALIDDMTHASGARATTFTFDDRPHELEVEYSEGDGRAEISLHWAKDGEVEEEIIPSTAYFTNLAAAEASCKANASKK